MKLIIDIGNSLKKIAFANGKSITEVHPFSGDAWQEILEFIQGKQEELPGGVRIPCILSSVVELPADFTAYLQEHYSPFIELDEKTSIPIINLYHNTESLGKDRLAAAVGGSSLFPGRNVLVITAGTCIIYDFVTAGAYYLGGAISPGLQMRFKALHNYTGKLPLVQERNFESLTGRNTEESILAGVIQGILAEIRAAMEAYRSKYTDLQVVFSGGDLNFFELPLKSDIFAVPNIVLTGLNEILDHNVQD